MSNADSPGPPVAWPHERDVRLVLDELQRENSHAHLMGIGGIGMAGVALLLKARGITVDGCDVERNRMSEGLVASGVEVEVGHDPAHLDKDVTWVVRSTAVSADDAEVRAALDRELPVFLRGTVLAALLEGRTSVAISGTHGKTTTTAMAAQVLSACGLRPGFCVGGEIPTLGVADAGGDSLIVVEADESDATVALYSPDIAVVTNIEYDHMEHFGSRSAVESCFERFVSNTKKRVVFCADDECASKLCREREGAIGYGLGAEAEIRAQIESRDANGTRFQVRRGGETLGSVDLPVGGLQNVQNALAVVAVAMEVGCAFSEVASALAQFRPVQRRFETICQAGGVHVISDYCHHPTEIRHVVAVAGELPHRRLVGVFQPHRFTRTRALGAEFPEAFAGMDELILAPVYAASEEPMPGGTSDDLFARFAADGPCPTKNCASLHEAWQYAQSILQEGDVLLILGAGDVEKIGQWAREELTTHNSQLTIESCELRVVS